MYLTHLLIFVMLATRQGSLSGQEINKCVEQVTTPKDESIFLHNFKSFHFLTKVIHPLIN